MKNDEEINQIIENLYEDLNDVKIIIKILKNEIQSTDYELYKLQETVKKEANSSTN